MKNLRKFGSVAAAGALAATMSVAGVTAANAATLTPGGSQVNGYYLTGGSTGVKAVDAEGNTATSFTDLRMAPIGGYTSVEYDENGVITDYTLGAVSLTTGSAVAQVGKAAGLGDSAEEVVANLKSADNWTAFIAAVKDKAGETFGSLGRALTLRSDNVYKPQHGSTDTQHIAGLHIVYSTSNAIEPFLIYTQVTDGKGTTVYPEGLSADNPYSVWKSATVDDEGDGGETSDPSTDVYLRVAGNGLADISPSGQGIDFAHSTPLPGVAFEITRGDGTVFTATTDANGWAKLAGAMEGRTNANYDINYTVTSITYEGNSQVEERLQKVEGATFTISPHNTSGKTSFGTTPEIKFKWNGVNVAPEGVSAAAGTFTIIYSTVFDGGDQPDTDLPVTGAAGIAVLVILGLVALGGGLALRRKKAQEQA